MLRLAVRVRRREAELVLAELLELAPSGVEEVDVDTETVEFAVYGAPGEIPELPALRAVAAGALVEVTSTEVADDWAERWREFHPADPRRQAVGETALGAAGGDRARHRDRPGSGVRDRRPCDHQALS